MKNILILILFLFVTSVNSSAQIIGSLLNEKQFRASINLVDDFIARFNDEKENTVVNTKDDRYPGKRILIQFNGKRFKSLEDSLFAEAKAFADTVMKSKTKLHYSDSTWYAKAKCHAKFKGRDIIFNLFLTVERRNKDMYKWVISKAEGDIFKLEPSKNTSKAMLMPDDHETSFMSLYRVTKEKDDNITYYSNKDYAVDETTSFLHLFIMDI